MYFNKYVIPVVLAPAIPMHPKESLPSKEKHKEQCQLKHRLRRDIAHHRPRYQICGALVGSTVQKSIDWWLGSESESAHSVLQVHSISISISIG